MSRVLLLVVAMAGSACSNVPVHRTLPPMNLGEPALFPTLEAHAQAPIVGSNRLTILLNGADLSCHPRGDPASSDDDHVCPVQLRGWTDRPRARRGTGRALPSRSKGARPARQRGDPCHAEGVHDAHVQGWLRGSPVPADRPLWSEPRQQPEPPAHPRDLLLLLGGGSTARIRKARERNGERAWPPGSPEWLGDLLHRLTAATAWSVRHVSALLTVILMSHDSHLLS